MFGICHIVDFLRLDFVGLLSYAEGVQLFWNLFLASSRNTYFSENLEEIRHIKLLLYSTTSHQIQLLYFNAAEDPGIGKPTLGR